MLEIHEVESSLRTLYPQRTTAETNQKRQHNIQAFREIIDNAIVNNTLEYEATEEQLHLYTTQKKEKIIIQFPGKESAKYTSKGKLKEAKDIRRFDFRPKIILPDGTMVKDLVFADMWSVVEKINKDHHAMLKCLSTLFFRMGRMISHELKSNSIPYEVIDKTGASLKSGHIDLTWYQLTIANEIIESLNYNVSTIDVSDATSEKKISFEAFIYFFDLILQNEDIKYNDQKNNLSSGRIQTSDSMLLLTSFFLQETNISTLIQRYISGFGVAKCLNDEVSPATGGLVQLVDIKSSIINILEDKKLKYTEGTYITVNKQKVRVALRIVGPHIAILAKPDEEKKKILQSQNPQWIVFDLETLCSNKVCNDELMQILSDWN